MQVDLPFLCKMWRSTLIFVCNFQTRPLNHLTIYCSLTLLIFICFLHYHSYQFQDTKNLPAEENREPKKKGLERENSNPFP